MRVGILGTGAIANKHAQAYKNIGFDLVACSNKTETRGREFAEKWNVEFIPNYAALCRYPRLDFIDVCTFPDFHLEPVVLCAEIGRAIQLQKPIATNLEMARLHIDLLEVLRQKTAGNLDAQERAFLEDLLYRLRVRYVQKSR